MARMKSTPVQLETPKSIDPEDGSDSKGGDDEFMKSLDSDELEMIECIAKPPPCGICSTLWVSGCLTRERIPTD